MKEKRKNNSKKFMAVIAIVIMLGLIIGMGAITYSKYVTSADAGSQTATAAKWGYVITADASKVFGKNYTKESGDLATIVTENGVAVKASGDNNVVAPGTTGSMTFTISGSAEVKAKLKFAGDITNEISLGDYKPIKWTLKVGDSVEASSFTDIVAFAKDLADSDGTIDGEEFTISWKWEFDGVDVDIKDSIIGYKAQGKTYAEVEAIYGADALSGICTSEQYDSISTEITFSLSASIEQALE